MGGIFAEKFQTLVARVGDIKVYEYSAFGLYLVRNEKNGAWLNSSIEAAISWIYKINKENYHG